MAPNKLGAPPKSPSNGTNLPRNGDDALAQSVITPAEIAARGKGTKEDIDTYGLHTSIYRSEVRVFYTGLMFLTRLPCPGWCDHHPAYLMRSMQWFPLFGAIVGVWAAIWYAAAAVLWPHGAMYPAAVSTLASVWLTGCFHEDGLADCFDGFGGGWGKSQILRIMKDSRVGTYALVGMALVLQLKLQALASLGPMHAPAALIAAHACSRWTCVPLIYCCRYLQDEEDSKRGLYNWFAQSQTLLTPIRLWLATGMAILIPYLALELHQALLMYAVAVVISVLAGYYGNLILGGVVGDYLGATIQVTELFMYLVLLVDWQGARGNWQPLALLAVTALVPIVYCRRVMTYGKDVEC